MDVDLESTGSLIDCVNVSPSIRMAVSSDKVTFTELSTTIGLEGLYDILEIIMVNAHNQRILTKKWEQENK